MAEATTRKPVRDSKALAESIRASVRRLEEKAADADKAPAPVQEMENGAKVLHQMGQRRVLLQSDGAVTKEGSSVFLGEFEALSTAIKAGIPCPEPYGAQVVDDGRNVIRMSFVPGQKLDEIWPSMSEDEKQSIARQLGDIITELRALEAPPNLVGGCGNTAFRHLRRYDHAESQPFKDEAALNDWLLSEVHGPTPTSILEALQSRMRTDHRIVLTHGDLSQHNILVQDGKITGLIDWEFAGWLPEHWEYVLFVKHVHQHRDWREYAKTIFAQSYHDELVDYLALSQYLKG
ncbi:hypothetical protein Daus18300_006341 [Diaporthe australafricana]|uniref:Aminoglycoside phosphotransferase domain-containing protein n=1 Tax=Diaporthe australafricana TaxID=127596 RepID=A0ABR3WUZ5_9PEZI